MRRALVLLLACSGCGSSGSSSGPFSPRPVDPEAIRHACAMEISCFQSPPITPGGSCVSQFEMGLATGIGIFFGPSADDLQRYVGCASSSSNCTDALDCASVNHGPDWCNAHPNGGCDGDTLVYCVDGWGLERADCSAMGLHCATANGASSCSDGKTCDPTTSTARCDGNRYVQCNGSTKLESSVDCGKLYGGGTCMHLTMGSSSTTGCFPPASGSCGQDGVTCDGATAVVCSYGTQLRVACGQFASHCVVGSSGTFDCVPDASNCTASTADSCDGNALKMCVNGNLVDTACSSIGLTTCQSTGMNAKCY